jgi:hypothetical protein
MAEATGDWPSNVAPLMTPVVSSSSGDCSNGFVEFLRFGVVVPVIIIEETFIMEIKFIDHKTGNFV